MIRDALRRKAALRRCGMMVDGREIEYGEIAGKANAVAALFQQAEKSEPVAILLPNGSDFIAAFYGVLQAGMVAFPIHEQLKKYEILRLLQHAEIKTLIASSSCRALMEEMQNGRSPSLRIVYAEDLSPLPSPPECGVKAAKGDPMMLLCTSGTVGKPKIVQLSEGNVLASSRGYLEKLHFSEAELATTRYFLAAPFSSAYGIMIITACLMMGFPLSVTGGTFTLEGFFRAVQRDKITHYEGGGIVVQLMEKMLGRPPGYDIRTLRFFGFGGGPVSAKTIEAVQKAHPEIGFLQGYGMTESAPLITKHERGVPVPAASVGTAIDGVTIAIQTPEAITEAPHVRGEVLVKGDNIMLGYYRNQEETDRVIVGGYLRTGDIGYLDEKGYLYLCGRKKNVILVRGFSVYPEEVENCLMESGLVDDCFVYGKADEEGRETVFAAVTPLCSPARLPEIAAYCRAHLASYKQPQRYFIRDGIEKNLSGKTRRR